MSVIDWEYRKDVNKLEQLSPYHPQPLFLVRIRLSALFATIEILGFIYLIKNTYGKATNSCECLHNCWFNFRFLPSNVTPLSLFSTKRHSMTFGSRSYIGSACIQNGRRQQIIGDVNVQLLLIRRPNTAVLSPRMKHDWIDSMTCRCRVSFNSLADWLLM